MVSECIRSDRLRLVKNPNYWGKGRPYLDKIVVKIIPDETARAQALIAGDLDAAQVANQGAHLVSTVKGITNYAKTSSGGQGILPNFQKAPGNDLSMRTAIAEAFDPKVSNQTFLFGAWNPAKIVCPPFAPGSPECVQGSYPKFNPTDAKKRVAAYKAAGNSVSVKLLTLPGIYAQEGAYYQQVLNGIGMDVTLDQTVDAATYASRRNKGDFQLATDGLGTFSFVGTFVYRAWGQTAQNKGFSNDPILEQALITERDAFTTAAQVKAGQDVVREMAKNLTMIWILPIVSGYATKSTVHIGSSTSDVFFGDEIWVSKKK